MGYQGFTSPKQNARNVPLSLGLVKEVLIFQAHQLRKKDLSPLNLACVIRLSVYHQLIHGFAHQVFDYLRHRTKNLNGSWIMNGKHKQPWQW